VYCSDGCLQEVVQEVVKEVVQEVVERKAPAGGETEGGDVG
jgi:hypothetical protein